MWTKDVSGGRGPPPPFHIPYRTPTPSLITWCGGTVGGKLLKNPLGPRVSSFFKDLLNLSDLGESFQKKRTPTPGRTVRRCGGGGLQINLGREASASLPKFI